MRYNTDMAKKMTGSQAFETYYRTLFSSEAEYLQFMEALTTPKRPVLRFNPSNEKKLRNLWEKAGLEWKTLEWYPFAVLWPSDVPLDADLPGFSEHLFYTLNASSLIPVLALNPQPGEMILDACAAPGGKALFIAEQLGESHTLVANDLSRKRRERMKQVFSDFSQKIAIWGMKAELVCKKAPEQFDKVLLDAPCSSEAHVYTNKTELAKWSENRIRGLKKRQLGLLNGVWHALKPGGTLVYSTCAVTPEENEWVVGAFLKKQKGKAQLLPWNLQDTPGNSGIPGEYPLSFELVAVRRVMPNEQHSPMFIAVFTKIE